MNTESVGYRNLLVWQKADALAFEVYRITKNFPKDELYGITSQMRRCALSVPANIVEGYARAGVKEGLHFYNIAYGSIAELEYFLGFSFRLGYTSQEDFTTLTQLRDEAARLLVGFMRSVRT